MATGSEVFLQLLIDAGVKYIFGNPGTTELPLMDALAAEPRLQYVLGLQEVPVVAMADGYAQAAGQLGVVNLHISCGLGNAMGMIYNAWQEGTPLLITAGQQDRRIAFEEPVLWSDMVQTVRPWTKWACEVARPADLPRALRRAVRAALTPPTGPVFLSLPLDVQMEQVEVDLTPGLPLATEFRPAVDAVKQAAAVLASAARPVVLAGSRVTEAGAISGLVRLAECLGAAVYAESGTSHGRIPFPTDHPLAAGNLPLWSPEVNKLLAPHDVVVAVGMNVFRQYLYHEPPPLPPGIKLIHIDQNPLELGKNYPLAAGVWGHLRPTLNELAECLEDAVSPEFRQAARQRMEAQAARQQQARAALQARITAQWQARPLAPAVVMGAIAAALPADGAVIEEAVTTTNHTLQRLGAIRNPEGYFGHRGWALGWGLGCALGVRLAWPSRPVLAILGEGAALYGIQGLWTAARYRIPVTFVICNNAQYQILKAGARGLNLPHALAGQYVGQDLNQPEIDIVGLAQSLGVKAARVADPDELVARLRASLAGDEPQLFDVPILRSVPSQISS